jgi:hypothetical protein
MSLGRESQGSTEASPKPGKKAKLDDERCISTQNGEIVTAPNAKPYMGQLGPYMVLDFIL